MTKNIVIFVLAILVLIEGYLLYSRRSMLRYAQNQQKTSMSKPNPGIPPRIPYLTKGAKFSDSPLFKYGHILAPGDISDETKAVMTGFTVTKQNQTDGSVVVTLVPKDSDDQKQQYTLKSGETLYFIEQTPADDKVANDKDLNLRDDYGVITDQNGIVQ